MAKRRKHQRPSSERHQEVHEPKSPLDLALLGLAVVGILLTSYLTYTAWFEAHPAFCTDGSGCDLVQSSRWSTFLGIPMAFWGFLTYVVIANIVWPGHLMNRNWRPLLYVALVGFCISAYLTIVSVVEIEATCPWCLASFGIITSILVVTILRRPSEWIGTLKEGLVIAVLIVGGLHLHFSGVFDPSAGPEDPQLQALAVHLTESGAKFFGAYWCPRCQEQKSVFGSSAERLPYVECSSGGRGSPLTSACAQEKIKSFPTWIINEQRKTGLQTPRSLAASTGFDWKE